MSPYPICTERSDFHPIPGSGTNSHGRDTSDSGKEVPSSCVGVGATRYPNEERVACGDPCSPSDIEDMEPNNLTEAGSVRIRGVLDTGLETTVSLGLADLDGDGSIDEHEP